MMINITSLQPKCQPYTPLGFSYVFWFTQPKNRTLKIVLRAQNCGKEDCRTFNNLCSATREMEIKSEYEGSGALEHLLAHSRNKTYLFTCNIGFALLSKQTVKK